MDLVESVNKITFCTQFFFDGEMEDAFINKFARLRLYEQDYVLQHLSDSRYTDELQAFFKKAGGRDTTKYLNWLVRQCNGVVVDIQPGYKERYGYALPLAIDDMKIINRRHRFQVEQAMRYIIKPFVLQLKLRICEKDKDCEMTKNQVNTRVLRHLENMENRTTDDLQPMTTEQRNRNDTLLNLLTDAVKRYIYGAKPRTLTKPFADRVMEIYTTASIGDIPDYFENMVENDKIMDYDENALPAPVSRESEINIRPPQPPSEVLKKGGRSTKRSSRKSKWSSTRTKKRRY